jgi:putative aldouronate transport system permease protein
MALEATTEKRAPGVDPVPPKASARAYTARSKSRRRILRGDPALWLMAAPAVVVIFVFSYLPMAGIVIAFQDYRGADGIFGSQWVGLDNFRFLFASSDAWNITFNTVFMNGLFIISNLVVALIIALLLNEARERWGWLAKFHQSVLFLPYFFSWVVVGYFALVFLDPRSGLLNGGLHAFGIAPVNWYAEPQYWPVILTVVSVWKGVGFWVVVFYAGILAISPEYFEAARLDRASKIQQIRYITLPSLMPLIILNFLLSIGGIFRADFGLFYSSLTSLGDVGMAAAAGLYQSVVGLILVLLANWLVRRKDADRALF